MVKPKSIKDTENFLVLGMDQRPGERGWRTDTIIVVAIDYEAKQVGLLSIPRDLWVNIPGYGNGRINQVDVQGEIQKYPGGGPALVQQVIQDELGIPTKNWVRLRLEALPELVDALGGVTVTLTCPLHELTPDPKAPDSGRYAKFDLPAGEVEMDGATGGQVRPLSLRIQRLLPLCAPAAVDLGDSREGDGDRHHPEDPGAVEGVVQDVQDRSGLCWT